MSEADLAPIDEPALELTDATAGARLEDLALFAGASGLADAVYRDSAGGASRVFSAELFCARAAAAPGP